MIIEYVSGELSFPKVSSFFNNGLLSVRDLSEWMETEKPLNGKIDALENANVLKKT